MKVIIIGATHAGTATASQILALDPSIQVTMYERHQQLGFVGAGVPFFLAHHKTQLNELIAISPAQLTQLGVNLRLQYDVLKVDTQTQTILVQNLATQEQFTDHYDRLVMATGSAVVIPPISGVNNHRVLMLKGYETAVKMTMAVQTAHSIVIAGGGYIGVELAEALCQSHQVTLIHSHQQLLNHYYDREMAVGIRQLLEQHGVNVCVAEKVTKFEETPESLLVTTTKGSHQCDLAIVATGFVPVSNLVQGQVTLDRGGAIVTNEYGQTSNPHVYAAGDVRNSWQNATADFHYLPQVTNAIRQAQICAYHICGIPVRDRGTQGTTAFSLFDQTYTATGITQHQAHKLAIASRSTTYTDWYRPTFMGAANARVTVILIYQTGDLKILGAQIKCAHDVTQAINVVSLAIQNHNTLADLAFADLFFHPRYNQPVNFLRMAAQQALYAEKTKRRD